MLLVLLRPGKYGTILNIFVYQGDTMKRSKVLSVIKIDRLTKPQMYRDSDGLYLKVGPTGSKSWVFRYMLAGRQHNCGLGAYPRIGLGTARKLAEEWSAKLKGPDPVDPLLERRKKIAEMEAANENTFCRSAQSWFERRAQDVSAADDRLVRSLVGRTCEKIWTLPAGDISKQHVVSVLSPLFDGGKVVTGKRLAMYIHNILAHAVFRGWRAEGHNPAQWAGFLDQAFAAPKSSDIKHHEALPYDQAPEFAAELRQHDGLQARALETLMLTATRAGDIHKMRWDQVDIAKRQWRIPTTKNQSALDVHLSDRVVEILTSVPRTGERVFPGSDNKKMGRLMKALRPGFKVHGLRATFKTWATARHFRYEAIEMTMGHKVGSVVERAYQRDGLPMERMLLLDEWASYLSRPLTSADVVPLRKA
jgi:integrase